MKIFIITLLFFSSSVLLAYAGREEYLQAAVDSVNKRSPFIIDSVTTLVGAETKTNKLVYRYKINNYQINKGIYNRASLKKGTTRSACNSYDTKSAFLDKGIILEYYYMSESNKYLFSFDVNLDDCKKIGVK